MSYIGAVRGSDDIGLIVTSIEDDIRRVQDRDEHMRQLSMASEGVRGSAISRQRDLLVEVDAAGRATKLQIVNQALSRGGTQVSAELMKLFTQAHQDAQGQILEAARVMLGESDPVLEMRRPEVSKSCVPESPRLGVVQRKTGGLW